jgi:hypothetical protein
MSFQLWMRTTHGPFTLAGLDDVRGHCRGDRTAAQTRGHLLGDDRCAGREVAAGLDRHPQRRSGAESGRHAGG